ncbi:MAG: hypothetical protein KGL52_04715 [Rhodospirillales bacterium]|nr:hypothetical protein [Rhodospirillales bacterium]
MNDDRRSSLLDFLLLLGAIWLLARWVRRVGIAAAVLIVTGALIFDLGLAAGALFLYSPSHYLAGLPVGLLLMLIGWWPLRKGSALARRRREQAAAAAEARTEAEAQRWAERQAQANAAAMRTAWQEMHQRAAQPAAGSGEGQPRSGYVHRAPIAALDVPPQRRGTDAPPPPQRRAPEAWQPAAGNAFGIPGAALDLMPPLLSQPSGAAGARKRGTDFRSRPYA